MGCLLYVLSYCSESALYFWLDFYSLSSFLLLVLSVLPIVSVAYLLLIISFCSSFNFPNKSHLLWFNFFLFLLITSRSHCRKARRASLPLPGTCFFLKLCSGVHCMEQKLINSFLYHLLFDMCLKNQKPGDYICI